MKYSIQKLREDFPVYLIENFKEVDLESRVNLVSLILQCKMTNQPPNVKGSFQVTIDYDNFFKKLYKNFLIVSQQLLGDYTRTSNHDSIWSYCSNKYDFVSIPGKIHNHLETSTINSVYYLNIPDSVNEERGSLSLFLNHKELIFTPKNGDLLIFPNYLDHRINNYNTDENWRVSINMEIKCEESADELFSRIDT
jgi:hypothetical protein